MDKIGTGVVGAGILGARHARVFAELPNARLLAVADVNRARSEQVGGQYGAQPFDDFRALLEDPLIEAVAVATPDHLHFDPVMAALAAGKHVLVEKPLATSLNEAEQMVAAAEAAGRVLQVNYSQRFVPEYAWTKQQVADGAIGRPLVARSLKGDTIFVPTEMVSWAAETSPIFFMTSHDLDLVRWYFEAEVEEVFAYEVSGVLARRGIGVHDAVEAMARFTNGAIATFHSAWIYPNSYPAVADAYLEVIGSDGVISLGRGQENVAYTGDRGRQVKLATAYEVEGRLYGAFRHSLELFLDSIRSGTEPMTSGAKTLGVTAAQCAIVDSLARRQPVRPREIGATG